MQFPHVTTRDLNGAEKTLPADFSGDLNLVLIAYVQWQQREVDSWLPTADRLEATLPNFRYYEVPVVGQMGRFGQMQLDFWMRTGIPDRETRARTLTLYVDRAAFRRQLGIGDEAHIALLLLDRAGTIVWRGSGAYSAATAASLQEALQAQAA